MYTHSASLRILPSVYGKWVLGPNFTSCVTHRQLTADGTIAPAVGNFIRNKLANTIQKDSHIFSLTVMTTTDCNLGCPYCFQNIALNPSAPFTPNRIPKSFLTTQIIDSLMIFVHQKMQEHHLDKSSLSLFGGEPLLNPQGCLDLLHKSESIGAVSTNMVTNGVLLKPKIADKLADAHLRALQISLDGDQQYHDTTRVNHAGRGSFYTIMKNSKYVLDNSLFPINFHINITMENMSSIITLLEFLAENFPMKNYSVSFTYIGDTGVGFDNNIDSSEKTIGDLLAIRVKAYELGIDSTIPSVGSCNTCGELGNTHSAVVSADGKLYSCWDAAGHENIDIGSVTSGFYPQEIVKERWMRCGDEYKNKDLAYESTMDHVDGYFLDYIKDTTSYFH